MGEGEEHLYDKERLKCEKSRREEDRGKKWVKILAGSSGGGYLQKGQTGRLEERKRAKGKHFGMKGWK